VEQEEVCPREAEPEVGGHEQAAMAAEDWGVMQAAQDQIRECSEECIGMKWKVLPDEKSVSLEQEVGCRYG